MYQARVEQLQMPDIAALTCEERLGLLVDRESTERENRRLTTRLRQAKLRQTACIEAIDYRPPRGLEKSLMARLATCQWVRERHNVFITGPTGIGKTWLGCALGHKASPFNMVVVGRSIEPSIHGCHSCTLFLPVVSFLDHEDVCGMPRD
jgi:DNA replication protein DnaC